MNDGEVEGGGARVSAEDKENRAGEEEEKEGEEDEDAVDRTCRLPRRCVLHAARISGLLYAPATRCSAARHDVSP